MQTLTGDHRAAIVNRLADLLIEKKVEILAANQKDIQAGFAAGGCNLHTNSLYILFSILKVL